jgi:hypothetical protein
MLALQLNKPLNPNSLRAKELIYMTPLKDGVSPNHRA